ncbi:zinc finger, CCHC-type containing protein [Tanacetum coccineum]
MVVAAMKHMASNFVKLDKFKGVDFRRWQKKMHFLFSSMSVVYMLTTPMSDHLFDIYQNVESSKELCDSLEAKYMAEDASSKKFMQHKINMDEAIQVSCIIGKLPPSWKDFKHTLKHNKEELTFVELDSHLRIEESLRVQDNDKTKGNNVAGPSVVNMVEHNNSFRYWFKTYESLNDGSILHMGNKSTTLVYERGCVDLRFSFGKIVSLLNVLHVPNIRKNLTGHVHFKRMQDMSKDGLIPAFDIDTEKCKTCILTLITKKPFQNVKCETKVLELIHSDLCDLHATLSLGNKNYFVTFIDDAYRTVVRLPNLKLKTVGGRGIECIFVGYAEHSKDFRPSLRIPNETDDIGGLVVCEEVTEEVVQQPKPELRKSKRNITPKNFEAINDEMDSIMGNNIWVLADLPPVSTPMDTSEKLIPNNGQAVSQLKYSWVMGCLMHAMTCTRPDNAFVVGKLSSYPSVLKGYTDASWSNNTEDTLSTSGWVFMLSRGVISWASKKQTYITGSTMKSKFMALAAAGKEAECAATLAKAYSQMYIGKSRHLGVRHSMIRELIMNGVKMVPKKRTTRLNPETITTTPATTSVTNAQLQAMIDQGVTAALAACDAIRSTNGEDSHNSGTGVRRNEQATRECTYPDFMKCQPLNFKGT